MAIAQAHVDRREAWRQRRVSPVQVAVADVLHDDVADNARDRREDQTAREQMPRGHFEALAGQLRIRVAEGLDEIDERSVVEAVGDAAGHIVRAAGVGCQFESLARRFSVLSAGLKAPPQGMSSTTSRKASNSRRPQNSGTAPAGPASPPGPTSTPAASESASRMFVAPIARSVSPSITSIEAGTSCGVSGRRVATTSICSFTTGTCGVAAEPAGVCADALAANGPVIVTTTRRIAAGAFKM